MRALALIVFCLGLVAIAMPPEAQAVIGARCGGYAGLQCGPNEWCEFAPNHCHVYDAIGTCVAVPQACTMHYAPVCGCDDRTYGNDCQRRAAKVQKRRDGPC